MAVHVAVDNYLEVDLQAIAWPVDEGRVDMAAFQKMADHVHRPHRHRAPAMLAPLGLR
jgi:hypothetical protein